MHVRVQYLYTAAAVYIYEYAVPHNKQKKVGSLTGREGDKPVTEFRKEKNGNKDDEYCCSSRQSNS